jgi:hypothetical protein
MMPFMMCCAHCGQQATMKIPTNPEQVCFEHALEFWAGVVGYAKDHSEPCVKHEALCTCWSCDELSASYLRAIDIAAAEEELSASTRRTMAIA